MLIAKTKEGRYFSLVHYSSRKHLEEIRKKAQFYCPQCNELLIMKIGRIKIPHFAHYKQSTCPALFSEAESQLHLAGKKQLFQFFHNLNRGKVYLEPYLSTIGQRPDLLYETGKKKIPIEFQCSRIPTEEVEHRTNGYAHHQMNCLWIIQTPKKLQALPQGIVIYSLSQFEKNFIRSFQNFPPFLFTYDAKSKNFHYLSSMTPISERKIIGNHRKLSISKQHFPFLRPNPLSRVEFEKLYRLFLLERKSFLNNRIYYNRKGINDPFLRQCYELKIVPNELPSWLGIPILTHHFSNAHPCEWQLAFLYYFEKKGIALSHITERHLQDFFHMQGYRSRAVKERYKRYLQLLLNIGVQSIGTKLNDQQKKEMKEYLFYYLQNEKKIEKI